MVAHRVIHMGGKGGPGLKSPASGSYPQGVVYPVGIDHHHYWSSS